MKKTFVIFSILGFFGLLIGLSGDFSLAQKKEAYTMKLGEALPANAFIELAKVVNPAVVNISTSVFATSPQFRGGRDPYLDLLEEFFGQRMGPRPRLKKTPQDSEQAIPRALGTGFIIREDGLIVTNNHVIAGADKIQVQINEQDKLIDAVLVGSDDRTDIALIKIEGKGFPVLQMGNSANTEVGEWVAAFGNPFGQGHTMTKGIISAKGRAINEINRFPLMQTDAPINPGNSGGPLVNLKGQAIGVNAAIDPRAQGIGFAIPIDEVKTILPILEKQGRIGKGYLGVGLEEVYPQIANEIGLQEAEGALIVQVEAGGPAAIAGMKPYDVVLEYNGKKIKESQDLVRNVADTASGQTAKLKIFRDGKTLNLNVKIADRPDAKILAMKRSRSDHAGQKAPHDLGFQVSDANDRIRRDFNLEVDVDKPVVVRVEPKSRAAEGGLLPGDVILDVNRREVKSSSDVMKQIKSGSNTFRVFRQNSVILLVVK